MKGMKKKKLKIVLACRNKLYDTLLLHAEALESDNRKKSAKISALLIALESTGAKIVHDSDGILSVETTRPDDVKVGVVSEENGADIIQQLRAEVEQLRQKLLEKRARWAAISDAMEKANVWLSPVGDGTFTVKLPDMAGENALLKQSTPSVCTGFCNLSYCRERGCVKAKSGPCLPKES